MKQHDGWRRWVARFPIEDADPFYLDKMVLDVACPLMANVRRFDSCADKRCTEGRCR
ncbi:hypothetical protein [Pseudomonas sp. 22 E 5]|nr:hypothetical protein [Pseudomonas sp. 31 E 5]CRM86903.1 hypothetical protein [Pseudomonas sp. 22 E 5]CRM87696.1 hypothetical protein [Pseudomonas sp. 22 E 5]CRM90958.1 hypothetical protein [Pseudomonas sp. 22 E 5]CRM94032.1 hypothetical protein [Pseudomonas sp. 22 E 5]